MFIKQTLRTILSRFLNYLSRNLEKISNLRLLLDSLSFLRTSAHINDFRHIHQILISKNWSERNIEHLMLMIYHRSLGLGGQRNELKSHEIKIYSQNGEDGLLLYVFSKIGVFNKTYINIGCGGCTSNTANLVTNFGWRGLDIDGNPEGLKQTVNFFISKIGKKPEGVITIERRITTEDVNKVIKEAGMTGEIDLLSIDIDGNDYWVWEAIKVVNPRVVLIEYNAFLGIERSLSVKYDPNFDRWNKHPTGWYLGASLRALTKLGKKKGYALIGCESNGVNAFFVRKDLIESKFIEISPIDAFYPHFQRHTRITDEGLKSLLDDMEYVEI